MEELVKLVSNKTGLSEDKAQKAVEVVVGYIKDKLPAPIAGQIDGLLAGGVDASDIAGAVGGLFGK
jgi:hypothetical protein